MTQGRFWKTNCFSLLVLMGLAATTHAQIPAGAGAAGAVGAGGAGAQPANIWSKLQRSPEQREACRERFCKSILGKILGAAVKPVAGLTGGLVGGKCDAPLKKDLEKPADSADGAAARIKQDELEAKKRVESVRYLATVNCKRWPEAELALINALRADRNECVRFAAAQAFAHGCCCSARTAAALSIVASGSNRDGFPAEDSVRVRNSAMAALQHCLSNCLQPQSPLGPEFGPTETEPPKKLNGIEIGKAGSTKSKVVAAAHQVKSAPKKQLDFYRQLDQKSVAPIIRQASVRISQTPPSAKVVQTSQSQTNGLFEIIGNAFTPSRRPAQYNDVVGVPTMAPGYSDVPAPTRRRGLLPSLFSR